MSVPRKDLYRLVGNLIDVHDLTCIVYLLRSEIAAKLNSCIG